MAAKLDTVEACYQQMLAAELAAERVELDLLAAGFEKYAQLNTQKHAVDKLIAINTNACSRADEAFSQSEDMHSALQQYIQLAINYVGHQRCISNICHHNIKNM